MTFSSFLGSLKRNHPVFETFKAFRHKDHEIKPAKKAVHQLSSCLTLSCLGNLFILEAHSSPGIHTLEATSPAVIRTIGDNAATEIMTRHLAKENANEICKRIIWGLDKDAPLEEIIRRCATVGTNTYYTQTMMNMERQGPSWQGTSREIRRCFQCGKVGHLRAQCRYRDKVRGQDERRRPQTPCPKCNRGFHWASECRLTQRSKRQGSAPKYQSKDKWGMIAAEVTPRESLKNSGL
ncbi:endogenous retrovirus group K member 6 Gag polyprotein-like isoform 1-T2 [Sarcophilus harrisii]